LIGSAEAGKHNLSVWWPDQVSRG